MFVFGICIGNEEKYARFARPGLERAVRPGDLVIELRNQRSIHSAYNKILEHARDLPSLETLVLVHEDLQISDRFFRDKVARALGDPSVGVVGAVGAVNVTSLAWWEGEIRGAMSESRFRVEGGFGEREVETLDGSLLCLSPFAVGNHRFDETYGGFHGYDADLCFSMRAAGHRVVVESLEVFHHTKGGYGDMDSYLSNDRIFRQKWMLAGHTAN